MEIKTKQLKNELIIWYKKNKRSFSWRETKDPWKILLIETLAQQTQLERANEYYEKFLKRFPTPRSMSDSSLKVILKMWSGLGYNNRAKRLYETSKILEKNCIIAFKEKSEWILEPKYNIGKKKDENESNEST